MRTEKSEGKRLSCLLSGRGSRMNYSRGGEQQNINLMLILNSDSAPRRLPASDFHPRAGVLNPL